MGAEGFVWFFGIVEDIQDPLKLGRVRVRAYAFHTEDRELLKTEHLPWATVLQPTTSAGINGSGSSPTGLRINSRVFGFFADGIAAQYPVVCSAFAGYNNGIANVPGLNVPIPPRDLPGVGEPQDVGPQIIGIVGPLSESQYGELKAEIARRESGGAGDLRAVNQLGFAGRYQFGALALNDLGYVHSNVRQNAQLRTPSSWKGEQGVNSLEDWLSNANAQERAMLQLTRINYARLQRSGVLSTNNTPRRAAGLLAVAHLLGAGGAATYARTGNGADANGTSGNSYYRTGYNAITDETTPRV